MKLVKVKWVCVFCRLKFQFGDKYDCDVKQIGQLLEMSALIIQLVDLLRFWQLQHQIKAQWHAFARYRHFS